ncbi:hypothetical protein FB451DRAFT_1170171 [Mycena latifolia]|nr:hypothetical protein FB451DRAFT_1170171 [Mycena latifolia]
MRSMQKKCLKNRKKYSYLPSKVANLFNRDSGGPGTLKYRFPIPIYVFNRPDSRNLNPESPLSTLLAINEPPQDSNLHLIDSVAAKTGDRFACLGHDVTTSGSAEALEEEHASVSAYRMQNAAILSPIRRIPPEVLAEIFPGRFRRPDGESVWVSRAQISSDDEPWPEPSDNDDMIELMHLQRIYVSDAGVLDYLRTPPLPETALPVGEDDHPIHHLEPFVFHSSCHIRSLCLSGLPTADKATEILSKLPSISRTLLIIANKRQELRTALSHFTRAQPVGRSGSSASVLPVGLRNNCDYLDHPMFLTMVKSRWESEGSASSAASLLIPSHPGPDDTTRAGLDAIHQEGLDLVLLQDVGVRGHAFLNVPHILALPHFLAITFNVVSSSYSTRAAPLTADTTQRRVSNHPSLYASSSGPSGARRFAYRWLS